MSPKPASATAPDGWHLLDAEGVHHEAATLRRAIAEAPLGTQIIRGHHLARDPDGCEMLNRIGAFDAAWARLLAGDVGRFGPRGLGVPEATLIHDDALRRLGASPPQTAQQLAALMLRARAAGIVIHDVDAILACRNLPEDWPAQRRAWYRMVGEVAGAGAAAQVLAALDDAAAAVEARHRAATPARLAMGLAGLCDRLSPVLGRAAETLIFGATLRRLRGMLRR